ncbi:hypothetical protein B484DRAFT_453887 [Ochromonadaceae sp. CCMP2298]|nr:hypothetical protein B484DRAFT_453887 [Ochromonadaceae sp. CCMP2298]
MALQGGRFLCRAVRSNAPLSIRLTSTSSETFTSQRSDYEKKLSTLRKAWQQEFVEKRALQEQLQQEDRRRIVQEKAIRLREKRKASVVRQEEARKLREAALGRYRAKLVANHLIWDEKQDRQQKRYERVVTALHREKSAWITATNVDNKITPDLFETEATTGLSTRYSGHWRFQALSHEYQLERVFHPERYARTDVSALERRLRTKQEVGLTRRLWVEDFLDPMIGSGEERAKYKELVDGYLSAFSDVWDDPELVHEEDLDVEALSAGGRGGDEEDKREEMEEGEEEEEEEIERPEEEEEVSMKGKKGKKEVGGKKKGKK